MSSIDSGHGESYCTPTKAQKCSFTPKGGSSKRSLFKSTGNSRDDDDISDAESDLGPISPLNASGRSSNDYDSSPGRVYESPYTTPEKTPQISLTWDRLRPSPRKEDSPSRISRFSSLKQLTKESRSSPRRKILSSSPETSPRTPSKKDQENINPKTPELTDLSHIIPETPVKSVNSTPQKNPERKLTTPLGSVCKVTPIPPIRRKSFCNLDSSPEQINKNPLKRSAGNVFHISGAKMLKIDDSNSRARASLFQEIKVDENRQKVVPLSTQSFYKNVDTNKRHSFGFGGKPLSEKKQKKKRNSLPSQSTKRRSLNSRRSMFGSINAGVKHGIKKQKPKSKRSIDKKNQLNSSATSLGNTSNKLEESSATADESAEVSQDIHMEDENIANENEAPSKPHSKPTITKVEIIIDPTKRFFKTNRTIQQNHVATVTVNDRIKLNVSDGKIALNQNKQKKRPHQTVVPKKAIVTEPVMKKAKLDAVEFDATDLTVDEPAFESSETKNSLTSILKVLENDWADDEFDDLEPLKNCFVTNQRSPLKSKAPFNNNVLLSPASVLSTMTSSMNIKDQAPTKAQNQTETTEDASKPNTPKLFPVFMKSHAPQVTPEKKSKSVKRPLDWQLSTKVNGDAKQYQIDAGQKQFGTTHCHECGIIYQIGEPQDENSHLVFHNSTKIMKFNGWKDERVVYQDPFTKSRIIVVDQRDSKLCWKKVDEVLAVIDKELGLSDLDDSNYHSKKIFLYIRDKTIIGLLAAEAIKSAHRMISDLIEFNCCSEEEYPAQCGVNVIWTAMNYRRQGIASKLLDIMRYNFYYGYILSLNDIAFSIPTPRGKIFAQKYVGTNNFLVYN